MDDADWVRLPVGRTSGLAKSDRRRRPVGAPRGTCDGIQSYSLPYVPPRPHLPSTRSSTHRPPDPKSCPSAVILRLSCGAPGFCPVIFKERGLASDADPIGASAGAGADATNAGAVAPRLLRQTALRDRQDRDSLSLAESHATVRRSTPSALSSSPPSGAHDV